MAAAIALREQYELKGPENLPSRQDVLTRYLQLRAISKQHNNHLVKFLSHDSMLQQARRLGLASGNTFILDDVDELTYVWDLAIHTAPPGRSRAIDRYARTMQLAPGSDEALVLDAMRRAHFAILRVEHRHGTAGVIVKDVMRDVELWLVDQGLEISTPDRTMLATRLFKPDNFCMTAGIYVPLDPDLLWEVLECRPQWSRKGGSEVADDRRFAEAIYRIALATGVTKNVVYRDPVAES